MGGGQIDGVLNSFVVGHLTILAKLSIYNSLTKAMDLQDVWSKGSSTDLQTVGRGLVG